MDGDCVGNPPLPPSCDFPSAPLPPPARRYDTKQQTWKLSALEGAPPYKQIPQPRRGHTAIVASSGAPRSSASSSGRRRTVASAGSSSKLWIFGGGGPDARGHDMLLNDLWTIDINSSSESYQCVADRLLSVASRAGRFPDVHTPSAPRALRAVAYTLPPPLREARSSMRLRTSPGVPRSQPRPDAVLHDAGAASNSPRDGRHDLG